MTWITNRAPTRQDGGVTGQVVACLGTDKEPFVQIVAWNEPSFTITSLWDSGLLSWIPLPDRNVDVPRFTVHESGADAGSYNVFDSVRKVYVAFAIPDRIHAGYIAETYNASCAT
jgi:hypothetical protein